jgi:hypothetical protein
MFETPPALGHHPNRVIHDPACFDTAASCREPAAITFPLLLTAPGFGWINAYTGASEIGDIERFASPAKLCG